MRIVVAGSSFFRYGGGIATYNRQLCQALTAAGHELLLIVPEQTDDSEWKARYRNRMQLYSTIIAKNVRDEIHVARRMFNRIIDFDPEVLISSNHIYLTSLFPCFADRRIRIAISHYNDGILARTAGCRPRATDWIIVLSESGKEFLSGLPNTCEEQIVVLYNSVIDIDNNVRAIIDKKCNEDVLRIVYPGGRSRHKSPDVVRRLVNRLAKGDLNWQLTWLGSAENFRRSVSKKARNRIVFTGRVTRPEAENRILSSHCIVLPSRGEGCPMTLAEAMRGGVIPLVSDCPSAMREVVDHGISGYIAPVGNYSRLVGHLEAIGRSQQLKRSLMCESRKAYERHLEFGQWREQFAALFTRRGGRPSGKLRDDEWDPKMLYRWHLRPGRWWRPSPSYLRIKIGYPNLSSIN